MLLEACQYLRNPGSTFARQLGYSKELIAIEARYRRHKHLWDRHLRNSQETIHHACEKCRKQDAVMVLGAGLLYDIPLQFLVDRFQVVYLVDVVFSRQTKKLCRNHDKLQLLEHDLNGLATQWRTMKTGAFPSPAATLPKTNPEPNLVISANVLSQLYLAPVYCLERWQHCSNEKLLAFGQQIIKSHLQLLCRQQARVCLLSDYQRFHQYANKTVEQEHALLGIELPKPDNTWRWDIAPKGELNNKESMWTRVYAYYDFKSSFCAA